MSTKVSNGLDLQSQQVNNLASPSVATDAANKAYVDALQAGLEWKEEVVVATTTNRTLSTAFVNGQTIDGVVLATGNRILLKNQTTQAQNGIYTVNASGAPTLATDANTSASLNNATVMVTQGTVNANTSWTQTTANPTVGTSNIVFVQYAASNTYSAGNGLLLTGSTFSVEAANSSITVTSSGISTSAAAINAVIMYSSATVGNGSSTAITITHNLGSVNVMVQLFNNSTGEMWIPDISNIQSNSLVLNFGTAPSTNELTVVVIAQA
jgi:hypothetical protein